MIEGTIPTNRLYPFQWNWDLAFTALGVSYFDDYRAWKNKNIVKFSMERWNDTSHSIPYR